MEILNLSAEPLGKLHSWLPRDLSADKVVFLPDACPGKSPLPTGTAVLTKAAGWRKFAVSDCGCGMRLLASSLDARDVTMAKWDRLAAALRANKGGLGDLGGGNHFLDAIVARDGGPVHFLVHTGSRSESGHVDALVDHPAEFDAEFARVLRWATDNRARIQQAIEAVFGTTELVLDLPHNTFEKLPNGGVVIRKGAVRLRPSQECVVPSHMSGDVVLVRATDRIGEALNSMSHGTGRKLPRGQSKERAEDFDFRSLRQRVLLPTDLSDASLRTEGPFAYRELDDCLPLIDGYVEPVRRFSVVAYMGHL